MARKGRLGKSKYVFFFFSFVLSFVNRLQACVCVLACVHACVRVYISGVAYKLCFY